MRMEKKGERVQEMVKEGREGGLEVVPFGRGRAVWSVEWRS